MGFPMPFTFDNTDLPGVIRITPKVFRDARGFFLESYKESEFSAKGITEKFVQDNHSFSTRGVLRGLHFQKNPKAQGKLVRVIQGAIWDVAVDIRSHSATYLKWMACELNDSNHHMLYIPTGFAHGFLTLSDDAHVIYKCTAEYDPACDSGIRYDDPEIGISWPLNNVIVSDKDKILPYIKDIDLTGVL
jgi:dTDP-4-dehydrorhamnose 3,5-epimerase